MNEIEILNKVKKYFGWDNKKIAEITGYSYANISTLITQKKQFPKWLKLFLHTYIEEIDSVGYYRIVYQKTQNEGQATIYITAKSEEEATARAKIKYTDYVQCISIDKLQ